jgi:hypothetical protein
MEKKIIDLEIKHNTQSLKAQLVAAQKEVQILSEKFGATSKEAIEAAKRAGELKDTIGDAKALTEAFNPDAKFKALTSSLGGVASGFAAYQGALSMAGVESKDLEKQLLKVQSAMAIAQGLQGIGESIDSFKQLKAVVIDAGSSLKNGVVNVFKSLATEQIKAASATGTLTTAQKLYTFAVGSSTGALKVMRLALVATGVGALIVAVGFLIEKIVAWSSSTADAEKANDKLNATIDAQANAMDRAKDRLDKRISYQTKVAELTGKTETEINKIVRNGIHDRVNLSKKEYADLDAALKKKRNLYLKAYVDEDFDRAKSLQKEYNDLKNKKTNAKDFQKEQKDQLEINRLEEQKRINDEAKERAKENADKINAANADAKAKREQRIAENKQIEADKLKANQELINLEAKNKQDRKDEALKEIEEQLTQASDARLSEKDKAIQDVNDKYFSLLSKAKEYNQSTIELEQAQADELAKIRKDAADKKAADLIDEGEKLRKFYEDMMKAGAEKTEKEIAAAKTLQDRKVQMVRGSFDVLTGIADSLSKGNEADQRKAFKLNKAASLGQAIVNTGLAVTGALTGGGNALKLATGMQFVEAGIVGTIGALNIAKIAGTQFDSGSGGGGGGATATAPQIPRFDIIASNPQTQLAQLDKQPIQAYVVSGEVTTAQSLERNRVRNATF